MMEERPRGIRVPWGVCLAKIAGMGEHEEREKDKTVVSNELLYENDFLKK